MTDLISAIELERSILGSVFLDPKLAGAVVSSLRDKDFTLDAHIKVFQAIRWLSQNSKTVDIVTVANFLARHKHLEKIGGEAYLSSLIDGVPDNEVSAVEEYCKDLIETSKLRALAFLGNKVIAKVREPGVSANDVISEVETILIRMLDRGGRASFDVSDISDEVLETIESIKKGSRVLSAYTTAVGELDTLTGGIHPGEYVIVGGRTGQGKSSLMTQSAMANAEVGRKVGVYSFEMTRDNLVGRMMATVSGVPYERIRDPRKLSDEDLQKVRQAKAYIEKLDIYIDDSSAIQIGELTARMRSDVIHRGIELAYVDYLQLVHCREFRDPYDRVTAVSAALRDLAKTTRVPVVALAQLKRPEQGRENHEPQIYDLKECGNIENDGFQVWLIYRPKKKDEAGNWVFSGEDKIIVGKNRNGAVGNVAVKYEGPRLMFHSREIGQVDVTERVRAEVADRKPGMSFMEQSKQGDLISHETHQDRN